MLLVSLCFLIEISEVSVLLGCGFVVVIAVLSMNVIVISMRLLFFFLFVIVRVSSLAVATTHASHVEVVHVIAFPFLTNGLGFMLLVFIYPLCPVDLNVSVLDFILRESGPVFSI